MKQLESLWDVRSEEVKRQHKRAVRNDWLFGIAFAVVGWGLCYLAAVL